MTMSKYSYYPGCSMESTARDFQESIDIVCKAIGIELIDLPDWNCCGATSTHQIEKDKVYNLSARNLVIAERQGLDVVSACASCYAHLKTGEYEAKQRGGKSEYGDYRGTIAVRNLLEVIHNDIGAAKLKSLTVRPLKGLRVAAYYGCLMLRPPEVMQLDDSENPKYIDNIVAALGGTPVEWTGKIDCCGGPLAAARPDVGRSLTRKLLDDALESEADCFVTACPMCQMTVDTRQAQISKESGTKYSLPIYYYTELIGVALDLKGIRKALQRHLTPPLPLLESLLNPDSQK